MKPVESSSKGGVGVGALLREGSEVRGGTWLDAERGGKVSTTGATPNFQMGGYIYDGVGNVKNMGLDGFGYDSRSRLTSVGLSGIGSQTFTYDQAGNLLTKNGTSGSATFCSGFCTNNQISGASYVRGNLTSYAGQTFAWDGLDRMASSTQSGSTFSYLYDGSDERAAKIPPTGSWTFTLRDESKRVESEYSGATTSRDNVFLGNQLVASYANLAVGGNDKAWSFHSSDHLGTPRLTSDVTGVGVARQYWPFGEAVTPQGSSQALRFAAMEFDAEGGTGTLAADRYYDHARSHVGGLGRFLSPDRVQGKIHDPVSWNRYAYAGNHPLNAIDPDGRIEIRISPPPPKTVARWTEEQRAAENLKNAQRAAAAERGELVKTNVAGRSTMKAEWEKTVGPVPKGQQLDHIIDRQLAGSESTANGQALDPSVNASNGVRTANAIKELEPGTAITSIKWTAVSVINLAGYLDMAIQAVDYSQEFKKVWGRDPTLGETAYYLRTGDRRTLEYQ